MAIGERLGEGPFRPVIPRTYGGQMKAAFITMKGCGNASLQPVLLLAAMSSIGKYGAIIGAFLLATYGLSAAGLVIAANLFAPPAQSVELDVKLPSAPAVKRPASVLLGTKATAVAVADSVTDMEEGALEDFVEVVNAVNMRSEPSSTASVVKVQRAGTKLRVASREGGWLEVVEPETGDTGWIYETFVKTIESAALHVDAAKVALR